MELLKANLLTSTSQIAVNSSSGTTANIFDPDKTNQWQSSGFNNDSLTTSITITFSDTQTVSRVALLECNWKKFNVYYNGVTANALTLTGPTTTSQFVSNSESSMFLTFATINCSSITFDVYSTQQANSEKAVGFLAVSELEFNFSQLPNASGYTPELNAKQIVHTMSDGGTRRYFVKDKWEANLSFKFITQAMRDDLRAVYDQHVSWLYVPFGTASSWDGIIFDAVWVGAFTFYKFSDNASDAGFSGKIELRETSL